MQHQTGHNRVGNFWKRWMIFLCIFCVTNLFFYFNFAINPSFLKSTTYNSSQTDIPSHHPGDSDHLSTTPTQNGTPRTPPNNPKHPNDIPSTPPEDPDQAVKRAINNFFYLNVPDLSALSFKVKSSASKIWSFISNFGKSSTVEFANFLNVSLSENSSTRHLMDKILNNTANNLTNNYIYNNEYIINEPNVCGGRKLDLIVVVCTAVNKFRERVAIRDTWGKDTHSPNISVKLVFILGKTNDINTTRQIVAESEKYHDIIQKDFIDSYRNLTLKSIAMVKWVKDFCNNSKFVLKADDDMYVNLRNLISTMEGVKAEQFVLGHVFTGARPIQDKRSKWYTPTNAFTEKEYPQYCSGTTYAMTTGAARRLYIASLQIPPFWLEDIYMTGLCARIAKIPRIHNWGFSYTTRSPTGCVYKTAITGHRVSIKQMHKIHMDLSDPKLKCK